MPFWTVEDACPYKEKLNFLMRSTHLQDSFFMLILCRTVYRPRRQDRGECSRVR